MRQPTQPPHLRPQTPHSLALRAGPPRAAMMSWAERHGTDHRECYHGCWRAVDHRQSLPRPAVAQAIRLARPHRVDKFGRRASGGADCLRCWSWRFFRLLPAPDPHPVSGCVRLLCHMPDSAQSGSEHQRAAVQGARRHHQRHRTPVFAAAFGLAPAEASPYTIVALATVCHHGSAHSSRLPYSSGSRRAPGNDPVPPEKPSAKTPALKQRRWLRRQAPTWRWRRMNEREHYRGVAVLALRCIRRIDDSTC